MVKRKRILSSDYELFQNISRLLQIIKFRNVDEVTSVSDSDIWTGVLSFFQIGAHLKHDGITAIDIELMKLLSAAVTSLNISLLHLDQIYEIIGYLQQISLNVDPHTPYSIMVLLVLSSILSKVFFGFLCDENNGTESIKQIIDLVKHIIVSSIIPATTTTLADNSHREILNEALYLGLKSILTILEGIDYWNTINVSNTSTTSSSFVDAIGMQKILSLLLDVRISIGKGETKTLPLILYLLFSRNNTDCGCIVYHILKTLTGWKFPQIIMRQFISNFQKCMTNDEVKQIQIILNNEKSKADKVFIMSNIGIEIWGCILKAYGCDGATKSTQDHGQVQLLLLQFMEHNFNYVPYKLSFDDNSQQLRIKLCVQSYLKYICMRISEDKLWLNKNKDAGLFSKLLISLYNKLGRNDLETLFERFVSKLQRISVESDGNNENGKIILKYFKDYNHSDISSDGTIKLVVVPIIKKIIDSLHFNEIIHQDDESQYYTLDTSSCDYFVKNRSVKHKTKSTILEKRHEEDRNGSDSGTQMGVSYTSSVVENHSVNKTLKQQPISASSTNLSPHASPAVSSVKNFPASNVPSDSTVANSKRELLEDDDNAITGGSSDAGASSRNSDRKYLKTVVDLEESLVNCINKEEAPPLTNSELLFINGHFNETIDLLRKKFM